MLGRRKVRESAGRRLADLHHGGGVDVTLILLIFALGFLAGCWVAKSD
jgi:hypothetical protein